MYYSINNIVTVTENLNQKHVIILSTNSTTKNVEEIALSLCEPAVGFIGGVVGGGGVVIGSGSGSPSLMT